jgi:hypothetical protein
MSDVFRVVSCWERRALRRERVFRDRPKPLDIYDDFELIDKYRFDRQSIMMICDMLQDDLERVHLGIEPIFFLCFIYMIFPYSH